MARYSESFTYFSQKGSPSGSPAGELVERKRNAEDAEDAEVGESSFIAIPPRIRICGDTVVDCSTAKWDSLYVVQPFRASCSRSEDALKGWTTNEEAHRKGFSS